MEKPRAQTRVSRFGRLPILRLQSVNRSTRILHWNRW